MNNEEILFEMKVEGLTLDPMTQVPIILLKEVNGKKILPIWVGVFEANAIALEMEKISTPRPMTHDLIKNIFNVIEAEVQKIVICDLIDNTFYAEIFFVLNETLYTIDSRPSDAIAVALRLNIPIYAAEKVVSAAKSIDMPESKSDLDEKEEWKQWLENVKPTDFEN